MGKVDKTNELIERLTWLVQQGQPKSVVVCASQTHVQYMLYLVCRHLDDICETYTLAKARPCILVDEARIDFVSIYEVDMWRCDHDGYGEFWELYGEWCYDRYVDQTQKECTGN